MKRNLLSKKVGSVLVVRQSARDAMDSEWEEFLSFLSSHRAELEQIRILIHTDGGVPTTAQRRRLAETLGDTHMLVAAVSDNMKVRFAGATISLFQRNYKQFTVAEMGRACAHLLMTNTERGQVKAALEALEEQLSSSS
jgi:hypothetical protein